VNHAKPYSKYSEWAKTHFLMLHHVSGLALCYMVLQKEMENEEEGNVREGNGEKE
jgi:hypothetical protein